MNILLASNWQDIAGASTRVRPQKPLSLGSGDVALRDSSISNRGNLNAMAQLRAGRAAGGYGATDSLNVPSDYMVVPEKPQVHWPLREWNFLGAVWNDDLDGGGCNGGDGGKRPVRVRG